MATTVGEEEADREPAGDGDDEVLEILARTKCILLLQLTGEGSGGGEK